MTKPRKHGRFSEFFTAEELAMLDEIPVDQFMTDCIRKMLGAVAEMVLRDDLTKQERRSLASFIKNLSRVVRA